MTEFPSTESEILAYVYGEMTLDARRAFEEKMAAEPALRAEVDGLLATRAWLGTDARFGQASGQDLPPPHLVDAIVRAEAIARPASVREALQTLPPPSAARGWLQRLNHWLVGGGVAVAATLAFWISKGTPEPENLPVADSALAVEPSGRKKMAPESPPQLKRSDAPEGPATNAALFAAPGAARRVAGDEAASAEAPGGVRPEPVQETKSAELGGLAEGGGAPFQARTGPSSRAPAARLAQEPSAAPPAAKAQKEIAAARETPPPTALSAQEAPAAFADADMPTSSDAPGDAESVARGPEDAPPIFAPAHSAQPPQPKDVARAFAASKRRRQERFSPERQKQLQLREQLRKQEVQNAAEMTLATAGIALTEGRNDEALELFVRASHEDRAIGALGAAPFIGQMRALLALGRAEQALALLPTLQKRTSGQSEERALAHWLAGQAAERLARLDEAKSHYRMAARSHASLRAQAMQAFERVQTQAKATKSQSQPAAAAPQASPPSAEATP